MSREKESREGVRVNKREKRRSASREGMRVETGCE